MDQPNENTSQLNVQDIYHKMPTTPTEDNRTRTSGMVTQTDCHETQCVQVRWARKLDFILAVMGFNIGFGNMLRFPYICMKNGGGTFLIPYFIFLVTFGAPLFLLELGLGQYSGLSPILFWNNLCPLLKGIGWCYAIYSGVFNIYYNLQMSWTLNYFIYSFHVPLPWSSCDNRWNTPKCYDSRNISLIVNILTQNCSGNSSRISAAEEFWEKQVLDISEGIDDLGSVSWSLLLGLFVNWILIFLCLIKGIHTLGKVVYVTVIGPYILLIILLVRGLFLPGGTDGIAYYLRVDWVSLTEPNVWLQAALQIFWSLAPCWGITISLANYNKFFNNIYRDAIMLPLLSGCTSFFAGFVTFAYVGTIAKELETSIDCVMKKGPGLAFVVYPNALSTIPVPQLWSVILFFLLVLIGLDSAFASYETVHHSLVDYYPRVLKKRETITKAVSCSFYFLLGIPLTTSAGQYIYQLIDWYQITLFMTMALFEIVGFSFCYGPKRIRANIKLMTKVSLSRVWTIIWMVVIPLVLVWLQITMFLKFEPVTYGPYKYPSGAISFGWTLAVLSILPLPAMAVHEIVCALSKNQKREKSRRKTLVAVLRSTLSATNVWDLNALGRNQVQDSVELQSINKVEQKGSQKFKTCTC